MPRQSRFFLFRDMQRMIRTADEPLGTICFLLSVTGMRIGEVLALRVQDLDFHRKLIKVRCSTYAGQIGTPKEQGERWGLADAARARIAPQEVPVVTPLS